MRHRQACDHCGGPFGMVTCRWRGNKFCKRTCKDAYLREVAPGQDKIICWYGFLRGGDSFKFLSLSSKQSRTILLLARLLLSSRCSH